jgi:hypothetical protein
LNVPNKTVIAKNLTPTPITLSSLTVTVPGLGTFNLSDYFRLEELWECTELSTRISAGQIIINNGSVDLNLQESLNWVTPTVSERDVDAELDGASAITGAPYANKLFRLNASGLVDGIVPSSHGTRHNPGGADPVTTAAPTIGIGAGNAVGTATSLARSDHNHALRTGSTDLTIGAISDGQLLVRSGTTIVGTSVSGVGLIKQIVTQEITSDTTTTSTTFVDLLSQTFSITSGSKVLVQFTVGCSNAQNNRTQYYRLTVDGTAYRAVGVATYGAGNTPSSGALSMLITGLSAGSHDFKIQWRVSSSTGQIRPVTAADQEHAHMILTEISA